MYKAPAVVWLVKRESGSRLYIAIWGADGRVGASLVTTFFGFAGDVVLYLACDAALSHTMLSLLI